MYVLWFEAGNKPGQKLKSLALLPGRVKIVAILLVIIVLSMFLEHCVKRQGFSLGINIVEYCLPSRDVIKVCTQYRV